MMSSEHHPTAEHSPPVTTSSSAPPAPQPSRDLLATIKKLVRLILSKAENYQFSNEELVKCGVNHSECDAVKRGINSAYAATNNPILGFVGNLFKPLGNFLDTVLKIFLFLLAFVLFLQISSFRQHANNALEQRIFQAQVELASYEKIQKEFQDRLKEFGINEEAVASTELEKRLQDARHWAAYEGESVGTIVKELPQDWSKAEDLKVIWGDTLSNYQRMDTLITSMPMRKEPYLSAAGSALLVLIVYIILQHLLGVWSKRKLQGAILSGKLRKELNK